MRSLWGSRTAGLALSAASGLMLFAAGEPVGLGLLAWVALVPLMVAVLASPGPLRAFACGLTFGVVFFGIHLAWIFVFGWIAWTPLTFVLALYVSVAMLVASFLRKLPLAPMLVAGAWVGAELLRDRWPFGGYSWGSLGTTQAGVPGVAWLAGTVGVYGLSFLIAFVGVVLAHRVVRGEFAWGSVGVVAIVLMGFVWADVSLYGRPPDGRDFRVGVVQGGVPRPVAPDQRNRILASHIDLTHELVLGGRGEDVDLVVWPEDALGIGVMPGAIDEVRTLAHITGKPFVVGRSVLADGRGFQNVVQHVDPTGEVLATYQKRHPVPFGEYVPITFLRNYVGTLESEVPLDLEKGTEAVVFDVNGTKVATPICFESVFPRDVLDFTRQGAELVIVSTNNASFERTYASDQHLAHARMRALETRQWFVQAALSGISAVIAPDGGVSHTTGLFTEEAFAADVKVRPAHSLYSRTGDVFPSAFAAAAALGLLYAATRRRGDARGPDRGLR